MGRRERLPNILLQNELCGGGHGLLLFLGRLAERLKAQQEFEVGVEVPGDPLLIEREVGEGLRVIAEHQRLNHGGVVFRVSRFDVGWISTMPSGFSAAMYSAMNLR